MYSARCFKFSDGDFVATYNRKSLLAFVNHREWTIYPGFMLAKSSEQKPLETALAMRYKYFTSVESVCSTSVSITGGILPNEMGSKLSTAYDKVFFRELDIR